MASDTLLLDLGNTSLEAAWADAPGRRVFRGEDSAAWTAALRAAAPTRAAVAVSAPRRRSELEAALEDAGLGAAGRTTWYDSDAVPMARRSRGTGADRLLASWWAYEEAGGGPVLVADCGTAWTLDVVDAEGVFRGGAIGAGLGLQQAALRSAAPHLGRPADAVPEGVPEDTAGALAAGGAGALARALSGTADAWAEVVGPFRACFLTGGDAARLAPLLPDWRRVDAMVLRALARLVASEGE